MNNKFREDDFDDDDASEANWQDSYSDLMTDLLAIFVILFSFAMMSQAIVNARAESAYKESLINLKANSAYQEQVNILPANDGIQPEGRNFNELYELIREYIEEEELSTTLSVTKLGDSQILLRAEDSIFFDTGKADLNASAKPLLEKISELFVQYESSIRMVRIEGHTDNVPIKNSRFDSNWELSASRAVNVLRRIVEISQLEPKKFSAVGYSEYYPIADNVTDEGRTKNRRVDFYIESME